ncbi:MAG: fasciclin domain-containing protein [Chloroflexi bacterium]|nr:fasciclin domain-containing protein [Chloroflexota bacterium]
MQKLSKIFGIIFLAVLVLVVSLKVYAQEYSPAVFVVDQDVVDGQVVVARAVINGPGWIVIHADANGAPGPVIGHAALTAGINADVAVPVDAARVTDVLYAMLHVDEGAVGTYEFPGADAPLMLNDAPVTPAFKVTGTSMTLVNTLMISDGFKTLDAAIKSANLEKELRGTGPFTLFAPTDAAFAELPKAQLDALLADPAALREVLLYHVLPGKVVADDVKDGMETATVQGATVKFSLSGGTIMINDATVKAKNIAAHNGVIHVIDKVLTLPESAQVTGQAVAAAAMTETTELTTTAAVSETSVMTPTATTTPTKAATSTATTTPTEAATPTATTIPTKAATSTATMLPTATTTPTKAATATATTAPTEAATSTATTTPTKAATSTATMLPTATTTPTEAATSTATTTPTEAATSTATTMPTKAATSTATMLPTATTTPTEAATSTATTPPTEAATATTTPTEVITATEMVTASMAVTETAMVTPTEGMTSTAIMTETTTMTETQAAGVDQSGATPEPTATVEPESTATAVAQEAPSVIVTPEEMPATGGSFSSGSATLPVVLCVMLALAAVAFVTRQRPA